MCHQMAMEREADLKRKEQEPVPRRPIASEGVSWISANTLAWRHKMLFRFYFL